MKTLFTTGVTHRGTWAPWALLFARDPLIAAGARPVLLMDDAEFAATDSMPMPLRDRRQRYVPGSVDFTAEREWRVSAWSPDWDGQTWQWWCIAGRASGLIVGSPRWLPTPDWITPYGQSMPQPRYADAFHGLPRWYWNGIDLVPDGFCDVTAQKTWRPV